MDTCPTNTSSRLTASHLQRGTSVLRLLLVVAAGLTLLGLALAVPLVIAANATTQSPISNLQPPISNLQPPTLRLVSGQASNFQWNAPQSPALPSTEFTLTEEGLRTSLLAAVTNGGFEQTPNHLFDWTVGGSAAHVEVLQASNFSASAGPLPTPTEGNYFALLCTGLGVVNPASQGNIDGDGIPTPDYDTSILTKTLSLTASDVPATLSFDWSFLTAEGRDAPDNEDDFFQVTLNGVVILSGSRPVGGVSPYLDVAGMNNVAYTVSSAGACNNCFFQHGRNPFQTFRMIISNPGTYTLAFLVADQGDADIDSGLLIDNLQLTPEIDLEINKTATPDPAIAGEPLIYEVTVINHGSGRAVDVVVTDTLPAQVDFIVHTLPTFPTDPTLPQGCSAGTGPGGEDQLVCDLGDVLGGESMSFEIEVDVDADALAKGTLVLTNTAQVDSLTADGNPRNDTVILGTILRDSADLQVTKVSKPDTSVEAGEIFTYTIHVDNLGPSHARNVVLTDTILSSGAFALLNVIPDPNRTSDSCTINGTIITCALGQSLEPQGDPLRNGRWVITIWVQANYAQDVNNEVFVFSADPDGPAGPQTATPDPDTSNNRATDFIAVTDVADLKMTKLGEDDANPGVADFSVRAGERVRWTIVVRNDGGPSTAENVAVVDILPRGLVEGSVTAIAQTPAPGGGQCTLGTPGDPNEPLICQLGNLAPTQTATVTIRADVDPSYVVDQPNTPFANYLPNDAYLTSDTFDPETQNNIVFDTLVKVTAEAELGVQKTDRPDYVIAGEQLEYTLTISNAGPSTAEDVVLRDELPDEVIALYVNVVNEPDATCTIRTTPANIIDCGFGNILPGKVITMAVTSLVRANTPAGTITNTVDVTSVTSDTVPSNNINITETTRVETQADLEIQKTSTPDKVYAGEQKKYTISVENLGPSDAQTVMVTDTLPISLTYEIDNDHCALVSTDPDVLECRYGRQVGPNFVFEPLPPGGTWQFDIWARVDPALVPGTTITNTAVVTGTTTLSDPNPVNNTDTAKNLVLQKADLKITKFGKPDGQVRAGEFLTYTVIVDNLGPSYAGIDDRDPINGNVAIKDILQSGLEFDLLEITSDRGMVCSSIPSDGNPTDGVPNVNQHLEIDCTLQDALEVLSADGPPNPGRWIITMTVTADETQDINNVAHVTSDAFDPDPDNNQAEVMHEITDVADLEVTKTAQGWVIVGCSSMALQANKVTAGLSLTYTLTIINHGPSTAENVVLQDRLPPWIVVTGATPSQGSCDTGTPGEPLDKLTCGLGTMGVNDSATVTITADVPSWVSDGTILENDAFVYSDIFDDTNANNFAHNLTTVSAWADLSVSKSDNPTTVIAGELLEYTVTITNSGPSDAIEVVAVDVLDPNVTFQRIRDPYAIGVVCSLNPIDEHTLTCVLGNMSASEVLKFTIVVLVNPDAPASLNNHISVSSDTADQCLPNEDDEGTGVDREQQLFVVKSDSPDPVLAGTELQYTITFGNNGPSEAKNVVVTDTLPLGVLFDHCESLDPNDRVTCSVIRGDGITTSDIVRVVEIRDGNTVVYTDTGTLDVGESYTFLLIANVESGYVLNGRGDAGPGELCESFSQATGYSYFAHNRAGISADVVVEGVPGRVEEHDDECTRVNAEADLELTKTDTPETALVYVYDPVSNGFIFTYTISVRNNGPSDSAVVLFTDTLPTDAEFITWTIPADMHCIFRDDGTVICLVGNGRDNLGNSEPGRLNVTSEISFTITARVDAGPSPRILVNRAEVQAVSEDQADVLFPDLNVPDFYPDDATPTPDPDLTNNVQVENTTVFNARVRVDKKAFLGDTAGLSLTQVQDKCETEAVDDLLVLPNTQVTYCYFIYSEGDTWLNQVELTDTPSGHVEMAKGLFVSIVGLVGANSAFTTAHALWASAEGELAPLAPAGQLHPHDYTYLLATRTVTVDFSSGGTIVLGSNTATVTAVGTTKYSTTYPGVIVARDTDLLHDTLALPVLEETTKEWDIYEDDGDGLPSPGDVIEYTVDIPNTGAIEATGVVFTDTLYNYIADDPEDPWVPALLIPDSVTAQIRVYGQHPVSGQVVDAALEPPDLAFGESLTLLPGWESDGTAVPGIVLTYAAGQVLNITAPDGDSVQVSLQSDLALPPKGRLVRFNGINYDPPIEVTFSLRIRYQVRIKISKYVPLGTIILNHGWLSYNEIGLFDQRFPDFDPANPNDYTADNKVVTNHNGTPGRAWESNEFPGWPQVPVNVEPTNYPGLRFYDYAQPGAALRDDDDPTWFRVERDPRRIQLPAIDNAGGWETQIHVQNAGDEETGVIVFFWGEYSGQCPYMDPGPVGYACKRALVNAVWVLKDQNIPSTARSAIVYSVDKDLFDQACRDAADAVGDSAAWKDWEDDYVGTGEPVAVIAQRQGPNDYGTVVSSAYPGISENMEGSGPVYKYFAPYAMRQYHNLDTEMIIQNSGQGCASITLNYQKQDDCIFTYSEEDIELAPGESIRRRVPAVLGGGWLGSVYVESDEPLGIVMDQTSFPPSDDQGVLLTYEAQSYKLRMDRVFYADLVWRELSGWDASIQVQNLTQQSLPAFVTVEFFDASGDSILVVGDWVCRNGGTTFYLPAITDLGMEYAGAAVIRSHPQVDYPGEDHDGEPIFAVVDIKRRKMVDPVTGLVRPTGPGENQGGAYNALAEDEKKAASAILLPFLAKAGDYGGVTSLIAVRNNSNCNDIALKLEVTNRAGTVVSYMTNFWLSAGHIRLIDLAGVGSVIPGFVGAGTVKVTGVRQLCDMDGDGYKDQTPSMPSVVVVNKGAGPGDVTQVYEGISVR
ncbi:MAG: DUF11 domain-containing protein [Anaerolineae bacterium]